MIKPIEKVKERIVKMYMNSRATIKKIFCKGVELVVTGIVFAVIASLLTTAIIEKRDAEQKTKTQLENLSNVYIGCNKQWTDEHFGAPQFTGQKDEYLLCAYVSEFYVLQMVFDKAEAAQAYLITSLKNPGGIKLQMDDATLRLDEDYTLGEFSFYDFPESPHSVYGFVSNGNGRALYSESYYFMGGGNYYEYCIAFLDFGQLSGGEWPHFDIVSSDIDDEVNANMNLGVQIITDRKNSYPNSYGVYNLDIDVYELLFTYDWFNSQQLRNKLNY